jgi:hypothetical protein
MILCHCHHKYDENTSQAYVLLICRIVTSEIVGTWSSFLLTLQVSTL